MCLPDYWEKNGLKNFDGVVWFRRSFEIPAEWIGKPLKLNLGMIDDEDITYFNGVEIARGAGYMTPRTYTIPAKLVKLVRRFLLFVFLILVEKAVFMARRRNFM